MTDVLIIGAGPSGAVASAFLAQKGYDVLVLERQKFPRFSIGESLLANSAQILSEAGMLDAVMARSFQFKNGAAFAYDGMHTDFNFVDKVTEGLPFTFQVQRAEFDQVLASEAARYGANIRYEVEITAIDVSGERPVVTSKTKEGVIETHTPRFVLDGSGFGRTLPRLLDLEKPSEFPARNALFCHVKDNTLAGAFDRQKIRIGISPAYRDVWSWLIPFSNGSCSLGIVATSEHHAKYQGTHEERLWAMVADEPMLKELLSKAVITRQPAEIVGFSANVKTLHGPGFALLGNAAEFLDPVFSSGVTIALYSAKLAAQVLDRQFRGERVSWRTDFAEPLMFGVETFRTFVNGWYDLSLQDVIFARNKDPKIHRMICSVLAGYAWDPANPYNGPQSSRRLHALAQMCRTRH
ncbi:MAG TPA: NAD(P)/FAD-dependent oxidoreductase [Steroidobacteraceae bacterium]|nr:NAD(P)/FAD-dependent oxidoreductase [Steroidobacteraceae bacterium]